MNEPAAGAAADETITGYSFRQAYEADAFDQFPLITASKLSDEARDRGIERASSFLEELERLDREGAFRPVLFEVEDAEGNEAIIFRDEREYVPWTEYAVPEWGRDTPHPYYSPWQLLYFNDAVELPKISVQIEWLLDDERRATLGPIQRTILSRQRRRLQDRAGGAHGRPDPRRPAAARRRRGVGEAADRVDADLRLSRHLGRASVAEPSWTPSAVSAVASGLGGRHRARKASSPAEAFSCLRPQVIRRPLSSVFAILRP